MITITQAHAASTQPASAFFARWIDHASWPQWDPDTEWVTLDGPVALGTTGTLKVKGGPKTHFTIAALEPSREYTDLSGFFGATLRFQHLAEERDGRTQLSATVTMAGPLAWLWAKILGDGFRASVPAGLALLVEQVEQAAQEHRDQDSASRGQADAVEPAAG